MKIEILGPGCARCHQTLENAQRAVRELGTDVQVTEVTDLSKITAYGVMMTPALVIDGEVKCSGKIPSVGEIKSWIQGKS